jgi:hypothetical protein
MTSLAVMLAALRDELLRQIDLKTNQHVVFKVQSVSPFRVYLAGDVTTPVDAIAVPGTTYVVGDRGLAIVTGLCPPICLLKTA